mmetsp:Transcript_40181/g.65941  ORF Transcript_40181/g.65941 Transcript_40181/m.65941 type:complete len:211 (-) Transcript_40181:286-918(-)
MLPLQRAKSILALQIFLNRLLDAPRVELHRVAAFTRQPRIKAIKFPVASLDGNALNRRHIFSVNAPIDTRRVRHNHRRARVLGCLFQCLHRLRIVCAQRHRGDVDIAVRHGRRTQLFFLPRLSHRLEFGHLSRHRRLTRLSASVAVDLSVENQHVDILALGQDMIESARTNIIRPAIAANQPLRLRTKHIALFEARINEWMVRLTFAHNL